MQFVSPRSPIASIAFNCRVGSVLAGKDRKTLSVSWKFNSCVHHLFFYIIFFFFFEVLLFISSILILFLFICCLHHVACRILVPLPRIKPVSPAMQVQSLNH